MDLVLRFMAQARFEYKINVPADGVKLSQIKQHEKDLKERRDRIQSSAALFQTRRSDIEVKFAWATMTTRYLAADRVSCYVDPKTPTRLCLTRLPHSILKQKPEMLQCK